MKARTDAFWMPFTPNRQFKAQPRMVASAQGVAYRTPDGREVLDGTSGLWCVGAGHRHPKIAAAMKRQIDADAATALSHAMTALDQAQTVLGEAETDFPP